MKENRFRPGRAAGTARATSLPVSPEQIPSTRDPTHPSETHGQRALALVPAAAATDHLPPASATADVLRTAADDVDASPSEVRMEPVPEHVGAGEVAAAGSAREEGWNRDGGGPADAALAGRWGLEAGIGPDGGAASADDHCDGCRVAPADSGPTRDSGAGPSIDAAGVATAGERSGGLDGLAGPGAGSEACAPGRHVARKIPGWMSRPWVPPQLAAMQAAALQPQASAQPGRDARSAAGGIRQFLVTGAGREAPGGSPPLLLMEGPEQPVGTEGSEAGGGGVKRPRLDPCERDAGSGKRAPLMRWPLFRPA